MLRTRVLTALVLLAVLLLALFVVPHAATMAFFAVLLVAGAWEWSAFPGWTDRGVRAGYALLVALACAVAYRFPALLPWQWSALVALGWWLVAFAWIVAVPTLNARPVAAPAGIVVLVPTYLCIGQILGAGGRGLLFLMLLIVWAADIGAYFAGRSFGRHALAPRVSPKKTWEGAVGGFAGALAVAALGAAWFALPPGRFLVVAAATAALSVVGDLAESLFKRSAGLKDSGSILPGHGGVLDRIDSITAAAPVFALGLSWLGVGR